MSQEVWGLSPTCLGAPHTWLMWGSRHLDGLEWDCESGSLGFKPNREQQSFSVMVNNALVWVPLTADSCGGGAVSSVQSEEASSL